MTPLVRQRINDIRRSPRTIQKAALSGRERTFYERVRDALQELDDFDDAEFARVLEHDGEAAAFALIPFDAFETALAGAQQGYTAVFLDAADDEAAYLGAIFDAANPFVFREIDRAGAELVTQVTDNTKKAIRNEIARAAMIGGHPTEVARAIHPLIGLTSRDARAVDTFRRAQLDAGTSAARAEDLAAKYHDRLLRARATTIARTETLRAQNLGRLAAWNDAADKGLIDRRATLKEWVASTGACPICADLDGTRVALHDNFHGAASDPPTHPRCRCTLILIPARRDDARARAFATSAAISWRAATAATASSLAVFQLWRILRPIPDRIEEPEIAPVIPFPEIPELPAASLVTDLVTAARLINEEFDAAIKAAAIDPEFRRMLVEQRGDILRRYIAALRDELAQGRQDAQAALDELKTILSASEWGGPGSQYLVRRT